MRWMLLLAALMLTSFGSTRGADWPQARGNASRSGYTQQALPTTLVPAWRHQSPHAPQRAWPRSDRQAFDACFQPIVADGRLFYGSSVDCKLYCLEAATGRPLWTYFTGGPIRFAPVAWGDRVAVASDDGRLHVLQADSGKLLWSHRGGPDDSMRLGNERMISKWPARGGPVLLDNVIYYAAGIWPSDGIFIYALDATTGKPVWSNLDSGGISMPQPHGGAHAESGLAAQGHLVARGNRLFVPTGRAVPAALDRPTGKLAYFHLQKNRAAGNTAAAAIGSYLFNSGIFFDAQSGAAVAKLSAKTVASSGDGLVSGTDTQVRGHQWKKTVKRDRAGKAVTVDTLQTLWTAADVPADGSLIVAGTSIVAGGSGRVSILDARTTESAPAQQKRARWSSPLPGRALGLAVADQRLYVSTDRGTIHCFAKTAAASPALPIPQAAVYPANPVIENAAAEILRRTSIRSGYCLDIGCGDGQLAYELARRSNLTIFAIESDPQLVARARRNLDAAGLYGTRVTVHWDQPAANRYPSYFANLIVSARSLTGELSAEMRERISKYQHPFGGLSCLGRPDALQIERRGALPGAGNWTHQYSNPANTVCSDDTLVNGALGILWFRDVDLELASRHGRSPSPLFHSGRLFHEGLDEIRAVDAYNGRELWSYRLSGVLRPYDGDHLMGTAGTGSNFCVSEQGVFARHEDFCVRIDATTGENLAEYSIPGDQQDKEHKSSWGYIACDGGTLFGSRADPNHVVTYRYRPGGDMSKQLTESNLLFAYDVKTGKLLWQYSAKHSIRHNAISIGRKYVYLIDRPVAVFDRTKKAPADKQKQPGGTLMALDRQDGRVVWQTDRDIYGTTLAVSDKHNVLLMSYQDSRFKLASELGGLMTAYDARTGKQRWQRQAAYKSRLTVNDRTIIADGGSWDLLTGEPRQLNFRRSYGCGVLSSSKHMFFFRSATLGYFDITRNDKVRNFGGMRPGCWINAIPAGGLVLVPDASAGCSCSYLNRSWFALEPQGSSSTDVKPAADR